MGNDAESDECRAAVVEADAQQLAQFAREGLVSMDSLLEAAQHGNRAAALAVAMPLRGARAPMARRRPGKEMTPCA